MNRKDVAPVTPQRLGSTEPGIPDLGRIGEQVSAVWGDYGYALVAGAGVLVAVVVVTAVVKVARSRQRDRAVGGLTALVVLAWTSEGLWEVARFTLGLPLGFAVMTFFVYEAMMLTCGLQAERHRKHHPSPGPAGRYVWVLAAITATVAALNAQTPVEALLRFTLPLAAAGLWWVGNAGVNLVVAPPVPHPAAATRGTSSPRYRPAVPPRPSTAPVSRAWSRRYRGSCLVPRRCWPQ